MRRSRAGSSPDGDEVGQLEHRASVQRHGRAHDDLQRELPCLVCDVQVGARHHLAHVVLQILDRVGHVAVSEPELAPDDLVVLPVGVAIGAAERPDIALVDDEGGVDQRGHDPQRQRRVVRRIGRPGGEAPGGLAQLAPDRTVHGAHAARGLLGLRLVAEADQSEHAGRALQALVRGLQRTGVGEEAGEGHRVGRLHEQRSRAGQPDHLLALDPAQHRFVGEEGLGHGRCHEGTATTL
jgi:hypothetical protein